MVQLRQILNDRYVIERPLGRGGMAQVYEGRDSVLGRTVAIKVLAAQYAGDQAFVTRFRREARAAAALNHPGVVSVFDTGSEESVHYIVMERVDGHTLAHVLAREGPLAPTRAAEIAAAAADALAFAHEAGLVHRDVKPGNIMITRDGSVKVMDFGIARAVSADSLTQTAAVFGTASYFSPEQARGERVDHRSDIYSLGVVLYEMLSGRPPFRGESPVAVAFKHVNEEPPPLRAVAAGVSVPLETVAMRALAKDPARRFGSAAQMARELRRAGGAEVAVSSSAEPTEEIPSRRTALLPPATAPPGRDRRRPVWPWALAVLAAALLAIGLLLPGLIGGPKDVVTSSPPASPSVSSPPTSPSPSPTASPAPSTLDDAVAQFHDLLATGVASGVIDDHSAGELSHDVDEAVRDFGKGDLGGATDKLNEAGDKVDEFLGDGTITSQDFAAHLHRSIDAIRTQMAATAPPSGEDHGKGKGNGDAQD
jgi:serine/threonine-protein kinase